MLSPVTPHRAIGGPSPLAVLGSGPLQPFLSPVPLHPLVVHGPGFSPQQAVGHAPAPADVRRTVRCALQRSGDLAETMSELGLHQVDDLAAVALRTAVLAIHTANQALRCAVKLPQNRDDSAAKLRAQKFPSARSHCLAEACG